jgi:hypothetical protein
VYGKLFLIVVSKMATSYMTGIRFPVGAEMLSAAITRQVLGPILSTSSVYWECFVRQQHRRRLVLTTHLHPVLKYSGRKITASFSFVTKGKEGKM